jgi:hypothetical protein
MWAMTVGSNYGAGRDGEERRAIDAPTPKRKPPRGRRGGEHHTTEEERSNAMNPSLVSSGYSDTHETAVTLVTIVA